MCTAEELLECGLRAAAFCRRDERHRAQSVSGTEHDTSQWASSPESDYCHPNDNASLACLDTIAAKTSKQTPATLEQPSVDILPRGLGGTNGVACWGWKYRGWPYGTTSIDNDLDHFSQ